MKKNTKHCGRAIWKTISKCVTFGTKLTQFEKKNSKCVRKLHHHFFRIDLSIVIKKLLLWFFTKPTLLYLNKKDNSLSILILTYLSKEQSKNSPGAFLIWSLYQVLIDTHYPMALCCEVSFSLNRLFSVSCTVTKLHGVNTFIDT